MHYKVTISITAAGYLSLKSFHATSAYFDTDELSKQILSGIGGVNLPLGMNAEIKSIQQLPENEVASLPKIRKLYKMLRKTSKQYLRAVDNIGWRAKTEDYANSGLPFPRLTAFLEYIWDSSKIRATGYIVLKYSARKQCKDNLLGIEKEK